MHPVGERAPQRRQGSLHGAHHLDRAISRLGLGGGRPSLHRPRGQLGIEGVRLPVTSSILPVGTFDLKYLDAPTARPPRQARTIAAGALDPD
jgi:hypothetical protein